MSYLEKVASRLDLAGLILLIVGAVLVYASSPIAGKICTKNKDKTNLIIKAAGCVVALIGTVILLELI